MNKVQEEQQKLLAEQIELSNRMIQSTDMVERDVCLNRIKQLGENRISYYSKPAMAEETAANARGFFPIFMLFFLFIEIGSISLFFWEVIEYSSYEKFPLMLVIVLTMYTIFRVYMYLTKYYENTMCLYYSDRICIKKYRKKDIIITYDEVKECIKKMKVKVHNGRFEYPYKSGKIYIYTWGNSVTDGFYKFFNKKCEVKMPQINKKEKDVVRRTGIGRSCYFIIAVPAFAFELFVLGVGISQDCGFGYTIEEIIAYVINLLFQPVSCCLYIGVFFVILGLILKVIFYFAAKKHFKNYEDIKVSLF